MDTTTTATCASCGAPIKAERSPAGAERWQLAPGTGVADNVYRFRCRSTPASAWGRHYPREDRA